MLMRLSYPLPSIVGTVVQAPTELELELGLGFASILFLLFLRVGGSWLGGWVGVEIEVNANSAPN